MVKSCGWDWSEKTERKDNYTRVERVEGAFYRQFTLPATADSSRIQAKSKQGVLEITIPKIEKHSTKELSCVICNILNYNPIFSKGYRQICKKCVMNKFDEIKNYKKPKFQFCFLREDDFRNLKYFLGLCWRFAVVRHP